MPSLSLDGSARTVLTDTWRLDRPPLQPPEVIMERRPKDRTFDQLRPVQVIPGFQRQATGSVLISTGDTRVLCAATVADWTPDWMRGSGRGWITAEYRMLPGSGNTRVPRNKNSRATEIQRLIGRSLRAAVDLTALDGFTIHLDCDVIDADGGTRTASITGAWVALSLACQCLLDEGRLTTSPIRHQVAAVSVGLLAGQPLLDLDYLEDRDADVDMNVVMNDSGHLIEVQGTAEGAAFSRHQMDLLLDLAELGTTRLLESQTAAIAKPSD